MGGKSGECGYAQRRSRCKVVAYRKCLVVVQAPSLLREVRKRTKNSPKKWVKKNGQKTAKADTLPRRGPEGGEVARVFGRESPCFRGFGESMIDGGPEGATFSGTGAYMYSMALAGDVSSMALVKE
jgi:hypothetical protein